MFKKRNRLIVMTVCLMMLCLLAGCGFHIGSSGEDKDYDDIFIDARAEDGKAYKHSMLAYNFSLQEYGEMLVYVDTTNGHKFKLVEGQSAFQILNKDEEVVVSAVCMTREQYEQYSSIFTDKVQINGRDFYQIQNDYGAYDACSYMADCGLDCGLALEADDTKLFRLVGFSGTPLEGSQTDQDFYKGKLQETEPVGEADEMGNTSADLQHIVLPDGSQFDITGVTVVAAEADGGYRLEEGSVFVPSVYQDRELYDLADELNSLMKEDSGETPVMDIHDEGIYLTGIYKGFLNLTFLAEGDNGLIYVLNLVTTNTDNSIDIINSIIDDFLQSGIAGGKGRTAYGEPVTENTGTPSEKSGSYYIVPDGYAETYICEYFECYSSDTTDITFNFDPHQELLDFVNGNDDTGTYLDMYVIRKKADFDSPYGKVTIIEAEDEDAVMDYFTYYAVSEDGTVNIDFGAHGNEMTKADCLDLIKGCVK